jgi:hypothetical protein
MDFRAPARAGIFATDDRARIAALPAFAQDFIADIPREQTLIVQGPEAQNADWFNLWAPGGGANTNGLQQLTADTFWFINPEGTGEEQARDRHPERPRLLPGQSTGTEKVNGPGPTVGQTSNSAL